MKCPCCWAEEAYVRRVPRWKRILLACALLRPMKCHHCYHKFSVFWFFTLGKQVTPPTLPFVRRHRGVGPSYAARHFAAARSKTGRGDSQREDEGPKRADAA
jgi:hypothetical protein